MKKVMFLMVALVVGAISSGCTANKIVVAKVPAAIRQDVFQESQGEPVPGKALLKIELSVKNYKARFINKYVKHTDPAYTVVLDIDGQSVVLNDEPVLEDLPGDTWTNPEAGIGYRYNFKKVVALQPGKHKISITTQLDKVCFEKLIELQEGENRLKLLPLYAASAAQFNNYPMFSCGLKSISARLNNQDL